MKILTYNVWFEQTQPERLDAVLKIIEEADADFICLQEMLWSTHEYFMKKDYFKNLFKASGS